MKPKTLAEFHEEVCKKVDELIAQDGDGFDHAYYDGQLHILRQCGDGGLSERYIAGVKDILLKLSDGNISGEELD